MGYRLHLTHLLGAFSSSGELFPLDPERFVELGIELPFVRALGRAESQIVLPHEDLQIIDGRARVFVDLAEGLLDPCVSNSRAVPLRSLSRSAGFVIGSLIGFRHQSPVPVFSPVLRPLPEFS